MNTKSDNPYRSVWTKSESQKGNQVWFAIAAGLFVAVTFFLIWMAGYIVALRIGADYLATHGPENGAALTAGLFAMTTVALMTDLRWFTAFVLASLLFIVSCIVGDMAAKLAMQEWRPDQTWRADEFWYIRFALRVLIPLFGTLILGALFRARRSIRA